MNSTKSDKHQQLLQLLERFVQAQEDPLALLTELFHVIHAGHRVSRAVAAGNYTFVMETLSSNEAYRSAVRERTVDLFERCRQVSFYTDAGILPNTGFFSELWRRLSHRILPDVPDPDSLQDCIAIIFDGWEDMLQLEGGDTLPFWQYIGFTDTPRRKVLWKILDQVLEAVQILATRIAALGVEPELLRLMPELTKHASPFLALSSEAQHFVDDCQKRFREEDTAALDESHLLVMVEQCRDAVTRAEKKSSRLGTSISLTFILVRLQQNLRRLETLSQFLAHQLKPAGSQAETLWATTFREAIVGVIKRNSVRDHIANLIGVLALRITDNASRVGEHYIAVTRSEYWRVFRSAAGAGLLIGSMALLKIVISKLKLAPLIYGLGYSLNYAACFVLVYFLHFTIATKQPAMTASTIAAAISGKRPRQKKWDYLVDLIVDTGRSQIAAIFGNVFVAFPVAILFLLAMNALFGAHIVTEEKAEHLLHDLHPLKSLALPHAGIAGFYLFVSGLISGYFDNRAAYSRIGERIAGLRWLQKVAGRNAAAKIGGYIHGNLGGLSGNALFGVMLGLTPIVGMITGLPLDIRHITFSAANLGFALVAYGFEIPFRLLLWCVLGIACIGAINLFVSFALALWTALRSRGIRHVPFGELMHLLWRRFADNPRIFFQPPASDTAAEPEAEIA